MEDILSQRQRNIFIGLLLGDGSLEWSKFKSSRLQIKQSESKEEYVFWLYKEFSFFVNTAPKKRLDTNQWYFGTKYYQEFDDFRKIFYKNRKKIVPKNMKDFLISPLSIAVWYTDDGRIDYREGSHYAYSLSTDGFTKGEVLTLIKILWENFKIRSNLQMSLCRGKRYPKIYIGKEGRDKFYKTVFPYILPCFNYKLPPKK